MQNEYEEPVHIHTVANILGALSQALADMVGEQVAKDLGLSANAAAALVHLSKYPDEPIDTLRKPLGLSHPGCVRLVDRLAANRLVERGRGQDRRTRTIRLTSPGQAKATKVLEIRLDALTGALKTLSPEEQKTLVELISKVLIELIHDPERALAICRLCDYDNCPDEICPAARALALLEDTGQS